MRRMTARRDASLLIPLRFLLEEANVTRAGERAQMSQSSMSAALIRLRAEFHDELLVRVGRDYELTPLARELLPRVQRAMSGIDRLFGADDTEDPTRSSAHLTVMMTDNSALRIQPALEKIASLAPELRVTVVPLPERQLQDERDLVLNDFVITLPGMGIEGESAALFEDEYVCLIDRSNPRLHDGRLSLDDFLASPLAMVNLGRFHSTPADRRMQELGIDRPEPRVTTSTFLPLAGVIAGTDLVSVVPRDLASRVGPATGTVGVPLPFGEVRFSVRLWWHTARERDPIHAWFRDALVEHTPFSR